MNQERYLGTYGARGNSQHTGELIIAGEDTRLKFIGRELSDLENAPAIYGRTENNKKVSCFDCIVTSSAIPFFDSDDHFERMEILPNFTLIGEQHLDPDASCISEVQFKLSDTESFFQDKKAFGSLFDIKDELQEIFNSRVPPLRKTAQKNSLLSYFCGDFNLITCESHLGFFCAHYNFKTETGRPFEPEVALSLKFKEPIQFHCSLQRLGAIRRFFTVITGRPQSYLSLELLVSRVSVAGCYKSIPLRVHFARSPSGPRSRNPDNFLDAPVNPISASETFAGVMQAWLAMDDARYLPRRQYIECMENESHYTTNRLVAAANMFDTLPDSALQVDVQLPSDFLDVVNETITSLGRLPKTDYRESLVAHLGRLQKPSLPAKLYHRSNLISSRMQTPFQNLNEVLRIAGQFRNFLVHGGSKFDYRKYESFVPFLTDTLEFVFAASDLIDAGWDVEEWYANKIWGNHQFTRFRRNYPHQITEFMLAKNRPRTAS